MRIQPVQFNFIIGVDDSLVTLEDASLALEAIQDVMVLCLMQELGMIRITSLSIPDLSSFPWVKYIEAEQSVSAL
jgi:hypothetical protein